MSEKNPFASPVSPAGSVVPDGKDDSFSNLTQADIKKLAAVVSDANQYWLAILLSLFCAGVGGVLISIWYSARLKQWSNLKQRYPRLGQLPAPPGSLQQRFQSAQWKLIVGIVVGCLCLVGFLAYLVLFGLAFQIRRY